MFITSLPSGVESKYLYANPAMSNVIKIKNKGSCRKLMNDVA